MCGSASESVNGRSEAGEGGQPVALALATAQTTTLGEALARANAITERRARLWEACARPSPGVIARAR